MFKVVFLHIFEIATFFRYIITNDDMGSYAYRSTGGHFEKR